MRRAWVAAAVAVAVLGVSGGATVVVPGLASQAAVADVLGHGDISTNSWSSHCDFVQQDKYDPILMHGMGRSMHLHDFFGANIVISDVTTPALLQDISPPPESPKCNSAFKYVTPPAGEACTIHEGLPYDDDQPDADGDSDVCDLSAYWTPALVERTDPGSNDPDDQTPMTPAYALTYYRNENITDTNRFEEFPSNYAVVAGDQNAVRAQDPWVVAWSCVQADGVVNDPQTVMPAQCVDTQTDTENHHPLFLRMVITFPDCVEYATAANGMIQPIGDGTPQAHVFYTTSGAGSQNCVGVSPGHLIPFIQVGVRWDLNSHQFHDALESDGMTYDLTNFFLVSDFQSGSDPVRNGTTAHADFMSGWTQATLDAVIPCLHVGDQHGLNCGYVVDGGST